MDQAALERVEIEQLAAPSIITLITLVPLFAFRELSHVLLESRLHSLLTERPG